MVSFSCEACNDVVKKQKVDNHRRQCYGASFSCLDCGKHFQGTEFKNHTSCISEDQKYQGKLYKEKNNKKPGKQHNQQQKKSNNLQALVPRKAYVESVPEAGPVAIVDAPPRAPTPPPVAVNVFDFLENGETPTAPKLVEEAFNEARMIPDAEEEEEDDDDVSSSSDSSSGSDDSSSDGSDDDSDDDMSPEDEIMDRYLEQDDTAREYIKNGFAYGAAPVEPTFERYESYTQLPQPPQYSPEAFYTPAPKNVRDLKNAAKDTTVKSDKKRKRQDLDRLDMAAIRDQEMTDAPPVLHSGLTGGLNRLMARPDFPPSPDYSGDGAQDSPMSPLKRSKHTATGKGKASEKEKEKEEKRGRDREERKARKVIGWTRDKSTKKSGKEKDAEVNDKKRRPRRSSSLADQPDSKKPKAIEYRPGSSSAEPENSNAGALVLKASTKSRAELFMSLVTKGPDSPKGASLHKVMKRYHKERPTRLASLLGRQDEEKELLKHLRLRKNDRGEIVLFSDHF